jgi:hypothetical protein
MKAKRTVAYLVCTIGIALCLAFLVSARPMQEPEAKSDKKQPEHLIHSLGGADLFHSYCASCHGANARGQGPVAPALLNKLPDLTTISKRNGGIFPAGRIESIISGDESVIAHGSREMPVWGPIFHQVEEDRDFGNVRLHNVTKYIETIQQK